MDCHTKKSWTTPIVLFIQLLLPLTMKRIEDSSLHVHRYCKMMIDFRRPHCFRCSFEYNQFIQINLWGKMNYAFILDDSIAGNSGVPCSWSKLYTLCWRHFIVVKTRPWLCMLHSLAIYRRVITSNAKQHHSKCCHPFFNPSYINYICLNPFMNTEGSRGGQCVKKIRI